MKTLQTIVLTIIVMSGLFQSTNQIAAPQEIFQHDMGYLNPQKTYTYTAREELAKNDAIVDASYVLGMLGSIGFLYQAVTDAPPALRLLALAGSATLAVSTNALYLGYLIFCRGR
jgi:hypothetical protein